MVTALTQAMSTVISALGALATCELITLAAAAFVVFAAIGVLFAFFGARYKARKKS